MLSWSGIMVSLLILNRVIFSDCSFLRNNILAEDDILEKFFAELKSLRIRSDPRHVTVIGTSKDQLEKIKPLLEDVPYFVGQDANEICAAKEFAADTRVVYFVDSIEREYILKVLSSLENCKRHKVWFVLDGIEASEADIESMLRLIFEKIGTLPDIIRPGKKFVKGYRYSRIEDCSRKLRLAIDWKLGEKFKRLSKPSSPSEQRKCPVSVAARHNPPWMNLTRDENGAVKIAGGIEGGMIVTIAEKLKFTPIVRNFMFSVANESNQLPAIVSSCADGNTSICIGKIHPSKQIMHAVDVTIAYAHDCMVWCVPRIPRWKENVMTSEFSWSTWILIGLTFLASIALDKIVRNTRHLNGGGGGESRNHSLFLDFVGLTIGNAIVYEPVSKGGKMLLVFYLCYSMVMTTGYRTSLSSLLTTEYSESSIVDIEGIIKANLTTGSDNFGRSILEQQRENELIPELMKRFVVESNVSKALCRVSQDKDFAFLLTRSRLEYHLKLFAASGEPLSIEVINACVITVTSSVVLQKSSGLTRAVSDIVQRLGCSGLLEYWAKNETVSRKGGPNSQRSSELEDVQEGLHGSSRGKFFHMFFIYCLALIFCTLVFLGELLVHKFRLVERIGRFKNPERTRVRRRVHF